MKRLIIEVLVIAIFSSICGLIYNAAVSANPLTLIPKPKNERVVSDEDLFGGKKTTTEKDFENTVTLEQMQKVIKDPSFLVIDARRPEQYAAGHIGNAVNVYPEAPQGEFVQSVFDLPQGKTTVIYCDGGTCDLSLLLAQQLITSFEYKRVYIYHGGWDEWSKKNR